MKVKGVLVGVSCVSYKFQFNLGVSNHVLIGEKSRKRA